MEVSMKWCESLQVRLKLSWKLTQAFCLAHPISESWPTTPQIPQTNFCFMYQSSFISLFMLKKSSSYMYTLKPNQIYCFIKFNGGPNSCPGGSGGSWASNNVCHVLRSLCPKQHFLTVYRCNLFWLSQKHR